MRGVILATSRHTVFANADSPSKSVANWCPPYQCSSTRWGCRATAGHPPFARLSDPRSIGQKHYVLARSAGPRRESGQLITE